MASPFKAFSPQPPKFFKPLMPVKEEHKRKTPLESRPLLSQEVIFENHLFFKGDGVIFVYLANRLQHASVAIEFCNYLVKLIRLFFICGKVLVFGVFLPETLGGFFSLLVKYSPLQGTSVLF